MKRMEKIPNPPVEGKDVYVEPYTPEELKELEESSALIEEKAGPKEGGILEKNPKFEKLSEFEKPQYREIKEWYDPINYNFRALGIDPQKENVRFSYEIFERDKSGKKTILNSFTNYHDFLRFRSGKRYLGKGVEIKFNKNFRVRYENPKDIISQNKGHFQELFLNLSRGRFEDEYAIKAKEGKIEVKQSGMGKLKKMEELNLNELSQILPSLKGELKVIVNPDKNEKNKEAEAA